MDRKQQLLDLIELNKSSIQNADDSIGKFQEELLEIEKLEKRPKNSKLRSLEKDFKKAPSSSLRQELTKKGLEVKQGNFVVWRGGLTHGPDANYIQIEQPIFNSENVLKQGPTISQHFEALYFTDVEDLKTLLSLNPTGIVSLPTNDFYPFRGIKIGEKDLRDGTEEDVEIIDQPLYDTNTVAATGTAQLNFFQVPLGGTHAGSSATPKTQIETNMDQGGSLPYPKHFRITGISVIPDATTSHEDISKFMDTAWVRLFIGCFDYLVLPVSASALGNAKRNPLISFRLSNPLTPVYPFPQPIDLIPQQNFRMEINFPTPQKFSAPFKVRIIMHGAFIRRHKNKQDKHAELKGLDRLYEFENV